MCDIDHFQNILSFALPTPYNAFKTLTRQLSQDSTENDTPQTHTQTPPPPPLTRTHTHARSGTTLRYQQPEGAFSNPNGRVNMRCLDWLRAQMSDICSPGEGGEGEEVGV